jgi:hypothetical protein
VEEPATTGQVQVRTNANVEAAEAESTDLQRARNAPVTFGDGNFPFVAKAPRSRVPAPVTSHTGESFDTFRWRTWTPGDFLSHALDHHT